MNTKTEHLKAENTVENIKPTSKWDDRFGVYPRRVAVDVASAVAASAVVAPIVTIIDIAVTEAAFGHRTIWNSAKASLSTLLTHPTHIIKTRPFAAMVLLYTGTYITANTSDTIQAARIGAPASTISSDWTKLTAVSGVNMCLSLWKDAQFAKAFGLTGMRPVPMATYATFVVRDGITLFASFSLPPLVASKLPESWEGSGVSRLSAMQLAAPAASQFVATPLHLLGLDVYHNPKRGVPLRERLQAIRGAVFSASLTRAGRVIPGLGIGNVINTRVRTNLMESIERKT